MQGIHVVRLYLGDRHISSPTTPPNPEIPPSSPLWRRIASLFRSPPGWKPHRAHFRRRAVCRILSTRSDFADMVIFPSHLYLYLSVFSTPIFLISWLAASSLWFLQNRLESCCPASCCPQFLSLFSISHHSWLWGSWPFGLFSLWINFRFDWWLESSTFRGQPYTGIYLYLAFHITTCLR